MLQDVFGWQIELDGPWDFGLIRNYGTPFSLRIRRETGVVFFGVEGPRYGKLCIRYAGAPLTGALPDRDAAEGLEAAAGLYRELYAHPTLTRLLGCGPAGGGYMAIFPWEEGLDPGDRQDRERLLGLPLLTRLRMADSLFDFHLYAMSRGIMPAGLWESSLRADPDTGRVTLCDIDRYRRLPAPFGGCPLYGSGRLIPPEAYEPEAFLDSAAAQYTLGALAFLLFARYGSRERGDWTAGERLYRTAEKACREKRRERFPSAEDFVSAWRRAAGETCL